MGERAAIPMQRPLDVATGPRVFEPARLFGLQRQRELIGMSVSSALVSAFERDISAAAVATYDRHALRRKTGAPRPPLRHRRRVDCCHQQRAPRQVTARQRCGWRVALGVGRRARASRLTTRHQTVIQAGEHAGNATIARVRPAKLAPLRGSPLSDAAAVLRVAARRECLVWEHPRERRQESVAIPRIQCARERLVERLHQLHAVP